MSLPRRCLLSCLALLATAAVARGDAFDDRVEKLFRPPRAEQIALSPDGQRVAYTVQVGEDLTLVIRNIAHYSRDITVIVAGSRGVAFSRDKDPARLRFLRWATSDRLVFSTTEQEFPLPTEFSDGPEGGTRPNRSGPTRIAPIMAIDADGQNARELLDSRDLLDEPNVPPRPISDNPNVIPQPTPWKMPHLVPLGFLPTDREQLIIEAYGSFNPRTRYTLNVRTGKHDEFTGAWTAGRPTPSVVYDDYRSKVVGHRRPSAQTATQWMDEELAAVQRELEQKFPRRTIEVLDWSEDRTRVLARITGGADPGRFFVLQRTENIPAEILSVAPWLGAGDLHDTRPFEFTAADGTRLSGYVTWPTKPKLNPPPLLVRFPAGFPGFAQAGFDPEAQVMADLGFVVLRLNHRASGGIDVRDRAALAAALDRVSVGDAVAAIDWLATRPAARPFDRRRVAALGHGFGGYLAVRALALQPTVFRCALALDAPMDLQPWLHPISMGPPEPRERPARDIPASLWPVTGPHWPALSAIDDAASLQGAVFLLAESARNDAVDITTARLREKLKALGRAPDTLDLDPGFALGLPQARAAAYRKMEGFFNLHLYDYGVKVGPTKEVK